MFLSARWKIDLKDPRTLPLYSVGMRGLNDQQVKHAGELAIQLYDGMRFPLPADLRKLLAGDRAAGIDQKDKLYPTGWRFYWRWIQFGPISGGWYEYAWHPGIKGAGAPPDAAASWGIHDKAIPMPPPPRPAAPPPQTEVDR